MSLSMPHSHSHSHSQLRGHSLSRAPSETALLYFS